MKSVHVGCLLLALVASLHAQAQFKPSPAPTETRPVSLPSPSKSSSDDDKGGQAQREEPLGMQAASSATPAKPAAVRQRPVYDEHGRRMEGMRQAGENRVMDTRTGRYHDTVPSGDGQRIVRKGGG